MDYLNRLSTMDNYAVPTYVPEDQASLIAFPSGGHNAQGASIQVDVTGTLYDRSGKEVGSLNPTTVISTDLSGQEGG